MDPTRATPATDGTVLAPTPGRMVVPADIRMCLELPPTGAFFLSLTVLDGKAALKASGPRELSEAHSLLETIDLDLP